MIRSAHRSVATALALWALIVAGCGTIQPSAEGSVSGEDVTGIQALVRTRAEAIGKGDLQAFLGTIDPARPALRRTQQQEFADPNGRISLARSTFKISKPTRYLTYVRAFVEEALEGNGYVGAFSGAPANTIRNVASRRDQASLRKPSTSSPLRSAASCS